LNLRLVFRTACHSAAPSGRWQPVRLAAYPGGLSIRQVVQSNLIAWWLAGQPAMPVGRLLAEATTAPIWIALRLRVLHTPADSAAPRQRT
jgi:hypothetical protein